MGDTFLFWRGTDKTTNWTVEALANLLWSRGCFSFRVRDKSEKVSLQLVFTLTFKELHTNVSFNLSAIRKRLDTHTHTHTHSHAHTEWKSDSVGKTLDVCVSLVAGWIQRLQWIHQEDGRCLPRRFNQLRETDGCDLLGWVSKLRSKAFAGERCGDRIQAQQVSLSHPRQGNQWLIRSVDKVGGSVSQHN